MLHYVESTSFRMLQRGRYAGISVFCGRLRFSGSLLILSHMDAVDLSRETKMICSEEETKCITSGFRYCGYTSGFRYNGYNGEEGRRRTLVYR